MSEITIESIEIKRSQIFIEGKIQDKNIKSFALYNNKKILPIENIKINKNRFKINFHLMTIDNNNTLKQGSWYLIGIDNKNNIYNSYPTKELLKELQKDSKVTNKYNLYHTESNSEKYNVHIKADNKLYIKVIWTKHLSLYKIIETILKSIYTLEYYIIHLFYNKNNNNILFASWSRNSIGGNIELVYNKMKERNLDKNFNISFFFYHIKNKNTIYTILKRFILIYKLALTNILIIDDFFGELSWVPLSKDVKVIQLWHGAGAFKLIGYQNIGRHNHIGIGKKMHQRYDFLSVTNESSAKHHIEAFGLKEKNCLPLGVPKTDIFLNKKYIKDKTKEMNKKFPDLKNKKEIITYAPTFRMKENKMYFPIEIIDYKTIGEYLLKNNSILFIKLHPQITDKLNIPNKYKDVIIDITNYKELNDFLFITDILITDYSSSIYEFSLLKRPMLFLAFDQEEYEKTTGFYEPYEDIVPGKIVRNFKEVIKCLQEKDYEDYKLDKFIQKNFKYTDGKSTDRIIDNFILKKQ